MDGSDQRLRGPSLVLVFFLVLVFGHVQSGDVCQSGCKGAPSTFKYLPETTYKYNYDGKIVISLSSAPGETTSTEVKAEVLLTQLGDCNQLLRLNNVQVINANGKKVGTIPDIDKPIRVNFNDGELSDSICVVPGDNQNSINVKRAIASIFQASLKSHYETDVFGRCPTQVTTHKEGNLKIIQKTRNLNKCAFRENIQQTYLTTAFNLNSDLKSSPLLDGKYQSVLKVKNGVVDQATVTEDYIFIPFSVGKSGAKAQVTSKLQFVNTVKESPQAPVSQSKSIIFEDPHPVVAPACSVQTIINAIKDVAKEVQQVLSDKTASQFVNLLKVIRVSKKEDLLAAYNQVKSGVGVGDKDTAVRLYLDALLRSGNGESVEALLELLKKNELNEEDSIVALFGLNVVNHATEGSLTSAAQLLGNPKLPRQAYLGIGNLAGQFCRQHDCENNAAAKTLLDKLASKLGSKITNREQENDVIFALKALRNVKYLNDNILQKLVALAQNKNTLNRVRVAALEAYTADACKNKLRDSALQVLQDVQQDTEIRIKAYLVVAQCPNAKTGNAIKALVEKEPSIQVGGFITSHIRSVQTSTNPDKALAKKFFNFTPKKRFHFDPRRYSFNSDVSYAVDSLGLGASSETNVIYSQNSWLPRSSSLNLTAQLFGHEINFLEIEARQENLDKLVEYYLGPNGVLKSTHRKEFATNVASNYNKLKEYVDGKVKQTFQRAKRDVSKAELEAIAKKVLVKANELSKDVDVDLTLKTFGAELFFLNINQNAASLTPEAIVDNLFKQLTEGLDKLNNFQETIRENVLLLDAQIDYPTSLGFPLRLAAESAANLQAQVQGSIDIRKIINNPENGQISVKVIPSVNIEVTGRLSLDALLIENGLKVVSTLHSATGADINLSWDKNTGFELKYGLPINEQKVISVNHEIVFHTREPAKAEEKKLLKLSQVKDFSICVDQLSPFTGLSLCVELNGPTTDKNIPTLPFPLSGHAKLDVTIENDDASAFVLKHSYGKSRGSLVLDTINKSGGKKASFELQGEYSPEMYLRASASWSEENAVAELRYIANHVEHSLLAKYNYGKNEYLAKFGVAISGSPQQKIFRPIIDVRTPSGQQVLPAKIEGQIVVQTNGNDVKYNFQNVKFIVEPQQQFGINGYVGKAGETYSSDLKVFSDKDSVAIKGQLEKSGSEFKYDATVQNSINPKANFKVKGKLKSELHDYENSLTLVHGPDLHSEDCVLTLKNSYVYHYNTPQDYKIKTENSASYPLLKFKGQFDYESSPKELEYDIRVDVGEIKIGSEMELKINEKTEGDYDLELDIWGLENKFALQSKRKVLANDESKISEKIEVNGQKLELDGKLKHAVLSHSLNVGCELTLKISNQPSPFKVSSSFKGSREEVDTFLKINSGSDAIIDAYFKARPGLDATGSIKLNIKDVLTVNGNLQSNKGSGKGDILIESPSGKVKVKAETAFHVILSERFDVSVTVYPHLLKNPNNKIFFSTKNQYSENHIDSENKLNIFDTPIELVLKASESGDSKNGKDSGEIKLTVLEQCVILKGDSAVQTNKKLESGQAQVSFTYLHNKAEPGVTLTSKGTWRDSNVEEGLFDGDLTFTGEDRDGLALTVQVALKTSSSGENEDVTFKTKIVPRQSEPFNLVVHFNGNDDVANYEIDSSCGSGNTAVIKGSYDVKSDTKLSGTFKADLQSTFKSLKKVSIDLKALLNSPDEEKEPTDFSGSAMVFAQSETETIIDINTEGKLKIGLDEGLASATLRLANIEPISINSNYKSEKNKASGDLALTYGDKYLKLKGFSQNAPERHYNLVGNLKAPFLDCQTIDLIVDVKRSKDNKKVISNTQVTTDGSRVHKSYVEFIQSEKQPLLDLKYTSPEGKLSEVYFKGSSISNTQFSCETRIINQPKEFELDGSLNAIFDTNDHIVVKGQVNCAALKWNKITFQGDITKTDTQGKVQVTVKSANKNLLSGTVNYNVREENGKSIAEGSGTFKLKEETKSGNFKYTSQPLEKAKNGEDGYHASLDAVLGTEAIDAEFKVTNSRFRVQTSYCEKKQDCVHFEIDNKISSDDLDKFEQLLEVNVDLRKLGLPHEFGLKAETKTKDWEIDHVVDAHFQNQANSKYQYTFALHPQEALLSLVTPKRIISLESKAQVSDTKGTGNVALYLDKKNHPNKKTILSWNFDVSVKDTVSGDIRFNHPGLKKPLSATAKLFDAETDNTAKMDFVSELDIFAQENQKIVTTYKSSAEVSSVIISATSVLRVQSKGLGIDATWDGTILANEKAFAYDETLKYQVGPHNYENGYGLKWNKKESSGYIKVLNKNLIKFDNKLQLNDKQQIIDSEISSLDNNAIVSRLEVKDYNTLSYSVWFKNTPSNKVNVNAGLILGQIADIRSEHVEGGAKKSLFYATVKLDEADFLKSDHKVDSAAIEHLLKKTQKCSSEYLDRLNAASKEWIDQSKVESKYLVDIVQKAQPNLNPLKQYYSKELSEFKEEIKSDKVVNELLEPVIKVLASLISAFDQVFDAVSKLVEESLKTLQATFAEATEVIETKLIPTLTENLKAINDILEAYLRSTTDVIFMILGKLAHVIELSETELKGIGSTFSGLAQDLLRVAQKVANNIQEYVESLPNKYNFKSFDDVKQQISTVLTETLPSEEAVVTTIGEVFNTIKELIPADFVARDDIVGILDTLLDYLLKTVKHEKVDENVVAEKIIKLFTDLLDKIFDLATSECCDLDNFNIDPSDLISVSLFTGLVTWAEGRSSILNYLVRDETSDEIEAILIDLVQNPVLIPPSPLFGMVVQGRHIFTFDGEQFTAPGSCNYLFARDAVNGNFSIAGSYKDGELTSITLADKTDQLTLVKGGQVKLGNALQDLPIRKPKIGAVRNYEVINLYSSSGASVTCLPDLSGCAFSVSGFYHSQVKGLLGNGNSEPFDDYTLPDGKVVTSESDFVNAYKLNNGCADVVVESAPVSDNAACNKLFSSDSSLSDCYPFISVEKFKSACARGLAAGVKGTEEALAKAYVSACQERNIDINVPDNLVKCTNSDKPYNVGDKFSVKLPSKSADVVLILDTSKQNEGLNKLLQPLVQDLTKEFHSKGINDVEYHLITYGGIHQEPTHFTFQGKMTYKSKLPAVKFAEGPKDDALPELENENLQFYVKTVKEILHDLSLATGMNLKTRTFDEAYKYPFRVTSLKSIIIVNGEPCEVGKFYPIQKIFAVIYQNPQISINVFTPVKSLGLKDGKKFKDIVGFNEKTVFTLSQGKKNPKGNSELHKEINYDDYCLEYVVNNRGNVFVNDNYLSNKAEQKQFVHIAAVNIVEQLINVEQGLDCECKLVNAWNAANVCKEVLNRERPSKKV